MRENVSALERELGGLREERTRLIDSKNDMAADLERLIKHKEVCGCGGGWVCMYVCTCVHACACLRTCGGLWERGCK